MLWHTIHLLTYVAIGFSGKHAPALDPRAPSRGRCRTARSCPHRRDVPARRSATGHIPARAVGMNEDQRLALIVRSTVGMVVVSG